MCNNLENNIVSYADDTKLYSEIITPTYRVKNTDFLNRDLLRIKNLVFHMGNEA